MQNNLFIEQVAHKIDEVGLINPAILLLEAHKPWAFLGSQLLLVTQPMLDMLMPKNLIHNLANLLAEDAQVEQLITLLEYKATNQGGPK